MKIILIGLRYYWGVIQFYKIDISEKSLFQLEILLFSNSKIPDFWKNSVNQYQNIFSNKKLFNTIILFIKIQNGYSSVEKIFAGPYGVAK